MNKLIPLTIAALALLAAPVAQAWTYKDGDVLLLFRNVNNPNNDVEYDIGSVNQFLGQTNGYTTTVTNWSPAIVQGLYGTDLTGVSVALLAVTSPTSPTPTAYVSGLEPDTTAYGDSLSDWNFSYYSTIDAIGVRPLTYSVPTASTNAYSINPTGKYKVTSYEYIASGGTYNGVSQLGGGATGGQIDAGPSGGELQPRGERHPDLHGRTVCGEPHGHHPHQHGGHGELWFHRGHQISTHGEPPTRGGSLVVRRGWNPDGQWRGAIAQ